MRKLFFLFLVLSLFLTGNCKDFFNKSKVANGSKFLAFFWPQGLSGGQTDSTSLPAPDPSLSKQPTLEGFPDGIPADSFKVSDSTIPLPDSINNTLVPVGKVYEIGLDPEKMKDADGNPAPKVEHSSIIFNEPVKLVYEYNKEKLKESGFTEEFFVYYFDSITQKWLPVKSVTVDSDNAKVTAFTDHFTPFVLVAAPAVTGTTTPVAPACIAADFPSGIGGSGAARFMTVDLSSMYYQDRNYKIDATSSVTVNTFNNLGFRNALGISTCNGGTGAGSGTGTDCQTNNIDTAHKFYTGSDYINFTAHTNLDVYLIHYDDSPPAPWIAAKGFVYTGMNIDTTVIGTTRHKVYKKTYLKGTTISLDGNWKGGATTNTNYFVILKRAGDISTGFASNLCEATPDNSPPISITNLRGIPGKFTALLQWENPNNVNLEYVVIRRGSGAPPSTMGDGVSPAGSTLNPNTFEVTGLTPNQTYFFSVFSVDKNAKWVRTTVSITTGVDKDGDGIADYYEDSQVDANGNPISSSNNADTDGDGVDDRTEIINGTNPAVIGKDKPVIYSFYSTPYTPVQYPEVKFYASGYDQDGITGWMLTNTPTPPLGSDSRWQATVPITEFLVGLGTHPYYIWAKDAVGNVNNPYPVYNLVYDGIKIPRFLYETNDKANTLGAYNIDLTTGKLSLFQTIPFDPSGMPFGNRGPLGIVIHPNGKYVYVTDGSNIIAYNANQTNGNLSPIGTISVGNRANDPTDQLFVHPSGKLLFAFNSPSTVLRTYNINSDGSLSYKTMNIFSNYMYNNHQDSYNGAVFKVNFSEKIEVSTQPPQPGSPESLCFNPFGCPAFVPVKREYSPINLYKNRLSFDPTGNFLEVSYINNIPNIRPIIGGGDPPVAPPGYGGHEYPLAKFSIDSSGTITFNQQISDGQDTLLFNDNAGISWIMETLPNFRFGYTNFYPMLNYDYATTRHINYPEGDAAGIGISVYNVSRIHLCQVEDITTPIQKYNVISRYNNCYPKKAFQMGFDIARLHLEPTGHFLYVPDGDDAHNGAHVLNAFKIDQNNGDLTLIDTDVVGSTSVHDVKVLDLHDYNDPPIINLDKAMQEFHNIDTGSPIFLNASNSYDPDYVRCNGSRNNFVYKWTLAWKPLASTKTTADIVNANTLGSAYLQPDITGDYGFMFSFTDDHGTCNGVNRTTEKYITIKVRKILRYPLATGSTLTVQNPMTNQPMTIYYTDTTKNDSRKPANIISWNRTRYVGGEPYDLGYLYGHWVNCLVTDLYGATLTPGAAWGSSSSGLFVAPKYWTTQQQTEYFALAYMAATAGCIVLPVCNTESQGLLEFDTAANSRNCRGGAYALVQWNPKEKRIRPSTEYGFWTYWGM